MKPREWLFCVASSFFALPQAVPTAKAGVVVRLDLREFSVAIATTRRGNLYTVERHSDGTVIAELATLEELRDRQPEVYGVVKDAMVLASTALSS